MGVPCAPSSRTITWTGSLPAGLRLQNSPFTKAYADLRMPRSDTNEEVDEGPQAVSPRDFVERRDVLTLDEYEARRAAAKA